VIEGSRDDHSQINAELTLADLETGRTDCDVRDTRAPAIQSESRFPARGGIPIRGSSATLLAAS